MGSWLSTPTSHDTQGPNDPLLPLRSPPHPSRSDLNPNLSTRSGFSYFLPVTRPELQTSHLHPTLGDVRQVADLLGRKIPPELVCRVMEEARYWAGCRNLLQKDLDVKAGQGSPRTLPPGIDWRNGQEDSVSVGMGLKEGDGEIWYLLSEEIGSEDNRRAGSSSVIVTNSDTQTASSISVREENANTIGEIQTHDEEVMKPGCWAREIIIETLSKDQGWSTAVTHNPALYGSYDQSFSWFEISLLRNGRELEGTRRSILNNVHAGQYYKAHRVMLGPEDQLVKEARKGDRVVLWARAQYPGWRNMVREAAITVYCAPFPQQN